MAVVADEIVICDDSSRYTKKSLHKAGGEDQYDEDEEEFEQSYSQMPFGAGGPSGQLGGITYAQQGGPMSFPRRTGGIDPSEGSGTKDDVPAMLNAGEFVMTRKAVKNAGNGSLNKGIKNMYSLMRNLEARRA